MSMIGMMRRLLLAAATLSLLAASSAAGQQTPPVVTVTTFAISGHGWGHGVGMGQWGAYGYALHGQTYDWILGHYYPGTQLATPPAGSKLRVLIGEALRRVTVSSDAPFSVLDGQGARHDLDPGAYSFGPGLRVVSSAGRPPEPLAGPLTFLPGKAPLQIKRHWRGAIEVDVTGSTLQIVNVVGLDAYIRGVVASEMPHDWPGQALEAQAVAARSYALAARRPTGLFQLYSDQRDQVYGGIEAETPESDAAVAATSRQVLLWNGKPALTYFSSSSGGRTAALTDLFPDRAPLPYLISVPDPYDVLSPHHNWGPVVLSGAKVSKALKVAGALDLQPTPATGHARQVTVVAGGATTTLPATQVRWALGLQSTWFTTGVLSLSRPQGTAVAGTQLTLTGIAKRLVPTQLEQRVAGSDWQPGPAIQPPAPDGSFSVVVQPTETTQYRLVSGKVASAILKVPVAASS
jgi:stage II sporulation protein D